MRSGRNVRPLIEYANEKDKSALLSAMRTKRRRDRVRFEHVVPKSDPQITKAMDNILSEAVSDTIRLGKVLGVETFWKLYEAVFDLELSEYSPAAGVPDLLLWNSTASIWFFCEVKAPGDYQSPNQRGWMQRHWQTVEGHCTLGLLA
jgi:hypothetical protein